MVRKIWQHDYFCVWSRSHCLGSRAFGFVVTCFRMLGNMFSVLQCLTKEFHKHRKTRWNVRKLWEQACTHTHHLLEYVLFHAFVLGYTLAMLFCTTDNVSVCDDSRPCYCHTQSQQCYDICIISGLLYFQWKCIRIPSQPRVEP